MTVQLAQATSAKVIFATHEGHPMATDVLWKRWRDALAAHGFPHVRLHSMRHTSLTTMVNESNGDIVAVSKIAGHSTIAITIDLYGREADEARKRGAGYMDRVTRKAAEGR